MATMTIRNIDDQLEARLRVQAARHGRSMEDEARDILRVALSVEPERGASLVEAIRARGAARWHRVGTAGPRADPHSAGTGA